MSETMSFKEIEEKYASEWVLIEDPDINEAQEIQAGRVIGHSTDREQVYRQAAELRPKWFAVVFTGQPPADMEFLLCHCDLIPRLA